MYEVQTNIWFISRNDVFLLEKVALLDVSVQVFADSRTDASAFSGSGSLLMSVGAGIPLFSHPVPDWKTAGTASVENVCINFLPMFVTV